MTGVAELAADAAGRAVALVRWPPAVDRAELVAALLAPAGSTIVVVPEGRLGRLGRALRATGATVLPWLTEGRPRDRARAWDRARRGGCVVLGGRSAVFAPVPDLAAVVIVDDGSEALKEERSPTWHARDVAAERARRRGARLTLVSPVPPLEAPGPVLAPARSAERAGWPITEVIDRRREPPGLGLFSERVVAALRAAAIAPSAHGVRAVCVLNRKGRARLLACGACGELARCERCDAAVAEADAAPAADGADAVRILACKACGTSRPRVCARCGSTKLKMLRSGVTRVREELAALLPGVGVAMVDAVTGALPLEPVLIGTEAVLHRVEPHPGGTTALVVFLDFDAELLAPRFRAGEQALWLIVRAARLVGPKAAGGRVLVQTRLPRHEVIDAAVRADPALLAEAEGPRRKLLELPPYSSLARLTGDAPALAAAAGSLRSAAGIGVSEGTGDAVLVRAPSPERLADALSAALATGRPAGRLRAEVDPLRV
jgi:primosomal protein N' (replication factor Y)